MNFCTTCGAPVSLRIPPGDNLARYVCTACDAVHYQNPKVVAGCVPAWGNRILMCRRAIEPRYGLWTLPAGFMENGETAMAAAAREAREEARAHMLDLALFALYSLPQINQMYVMFRGVLRDGAAGVGEESLEVRLFDESEIPWAELAFPTIHETLERYFVDRRAGAFGIHHGDITRDADRRVQVRRYQPAYLSRRGS
ncbi:MAG: NUDIX hydrolase, partial [Gammaproteobacteria bacterium]